MLIPEGLRTPMSMRDQLRTELGWPRPAPLHVPPEATWPPRTLGPAVPFTVGGVQQSLFGAFPTTARLG